MEYFITADFFLVIAVYYTCFLTVLYKFHASLSMVHGITSSFGKLRLEGGVGGEEPSTLLPSCLYQVDTIVVECSHTGSLVRSIRSVDVCTTIVFLCISFYNKQPQYCGMEVSFMLVSGVCWSFSLRRPNRVCVQWGKIPPQPVFCRKPFVINFLTYLKKIFYTYRWNESTSHVWHSKSFGKQRKKNVYNHLICPHYL